LPLRILADNGEYSFQNKGDLAIVAVTVERLLERWPDAGIGVITFGGEEDAQPTPWEQSAPTAIDESDLVIAVGGG
jgi:hypothetical protein